MSNPRILLATSDPDFERRVRSAFGGSLNGSLATIGSSAALEQAIIDRDPEVVAVGPGVPLEEALALAARIDAARPDVSVLLVEAPTADLYRDALHAGVRDILNPEAADAEVFETFGRAVDASRRRRSATRPPVEDGPPRRVIVLVSPKGGSGKTTIATNVAVGLARSNPGEVAILDLDLQFGDVATALRVVPEHTMADAARSGRDLDAMSLKVLLTQHPSGVYALCGPENPADGEDITAEHVTTVIRLLSEEFPYVVIDTSAGLHESTLAAIESASDLVLMCAFDVPSVRSVQKVVHALDQLGMTRQRRHFVLNRADSRVGLTTADVEATIGLPVDVAISSSRLVPLSMNQGTPVLESEPRSPVAKQMAALAARFVEQPATPGGTRLFKRGSR